MGSDRQQELEGLQVVLRGLMAGLALMPEGCDSLRELGPLEGALQVKIRRLDPEQSPGRLRRVRRRDV